MVLTTEIWKKMLLSVADLFTENITPLSELDAVIGDGDHGITIGKIGKLIREQVAAVDESPALLFKTIGKKLMSLPGGSACPLYGLYFGGFEKGAGDGECDVATMKAMFAAGLKKLDSMSGAKVGDKTMMDACIPGTNAVVNGEGTPAEILRKAADEAKAGALATKGFVSKFGRAKSYGERTIGYADPGAMSMSLVFEGFARALEAM